MTIKIPQAAMDALIKSRNDWADYRDGKMIFNTKPSCALCHYDRKYGKNDCVICPIFMKTNQQGCGGTPYASAFTDPAEMTAFLDGLITECAVERDQKWPTKMK